MLSCRKTPTARHHRGSLSNHNAVEKLAILCSTVFVMRARAVISQVSGSHVLGHSHFTGLAYPYCDRFDSVNARGSQRIFQRVTISILPCLSGLFPLSDLWYSSRSPSHQPSTSLLCVLQLSLSRTTPHRYSVGD